MRILTLALVFMVGALVGAVAVGAVGYFWIGPQVAQDKFDFGYMNGTINAQVDIARKIDALLGRDFDRHEPSEPFYGVKETSVVVVTRNGVKTLRTCCDDAELQGKPTGLTNR